MDQMYYNNPVISGFYPDPSICRAGDVYYLVCSSFQFFPGVPLFESRDLINWTQIGHVLTRRSQLPLAHANSVGGIYAPTIRFDRGTFYMVTTNVTGGGHFYVKTNDIHGEWSEPVYVKQQGIDPSLFFEDGRAYFMCNGEDENGGCILQCEIDIETGACLTAPQVIWRGTGGRFLESPHLYHIGQYYYLMASEGGTEYGHMVVYARGLSPFGPFEAYAQNPVLTNRNLAGCALQGCGHADLVEDINGNWWMLHLGFRQITDWMMFHTTGRETCLVPVTFGADGWFTAGEDGTSRLRMQTDRLPETVTQRLQKHYDLRNTASGREWVFLQNPDMQQYELSEDAFILSGTENGIGTEDASPVFIGIRQKEMQFRLCCKVSIAAQTAGLTVYMTASQHYDIYVQPQAAGGFAVICRAVLGTVVHEVGRVMLPPDADSAALCITGEPLHYQFSCMTGGTEHVLGILESKYLSSEVAGNFTGVMLGLFAEHPQAKGVRSAFTDWTLDYA